MWLTIIVKFFIIELLCETIHHSWYYHTCSDDLHSSDIEAVVFGYVYVYISNIKFGPILTQILFGKWIAMVKVDTFWQLWPSLFT